MKTIMTVVLVIGMMTAAQGQETVTLNGTEFRTSQIGEYDIPTYEWYQYEGYEAFYMDGSYPQMTEMVKKILGSKFDHPTKSFAISEFAHHKEWEGITLNGRMVDVAITKNMYDSTIMVYFYEEDGHPDELLKK